MISQFSPDLDAIKLKELNVTPLFTAYYFPFFRQQLDKGESINDEMMAWIVNPPPIFASADKKAEEENTKIFFANREMSKRLVRSMKKEFYDFLCTESKHYSKERSLMSGNINILITGISASIATKVGSVETGVITSFVITFILLVGKLGRRAVCEAFSPNNLK